MRNLVSKISTTALITSVLFIAGCGIDSSPGPDPQVSSAAANDWDQFVDNFVEDFLAAHPMYAVSAGRHEFDGLLPDWSREGIDSEVSRLKAQREAALAFDDATLTDAQKFQKNHLLARIGRDLFWLDEMQWPFRNPEFYFDFLGDRFDPSVYLLRDYAPAAERMAAFTAFLQNVPAAAAQIQENLSGPLPLPYIDYGAGVFGGMGSYFSDGLGMVFQDVDDPDLRERFDAAAAMAATAMEELAAALQSQRGNAPEEFAIGEESFYRMLQQSEMIDISLAELEQIGLADLARNTAALRVACEEFLPGTDLSACISRMSANKPQGGAVEGAREQLDILRDHVASVDFVTIPSDQQAQVAESPPFARFNFAYILIDGPYEDVQSATYFISPPDPSWSEEVQQAYIYGQGALYSVSAHEVWPGHFLGFLHSNRSDSMLGRLFVSIASVEGWGHYAEELMAETGFLGGDPEFRIGQITQALMRNVRFLCAIGMHTGELTLDQCQKRFENEAFQDEGTARQQALRGAYDPMYVSYTLGKLMIRRLRDDWSSSRGGRRAWKEFHDEFLAFGGPPVALIRGAMLGADPATGLSALQIEAR